MVHLSDKRLIGFFDLPREIRDEIYRYYFEKRYWISFKPLRCPRRRALIKPLLYLHDEVQLKITQSIFPDNAICQVSPESADFLFANSIFSYTNRKHYCKCTKAVYSTPAPGTAEHIQHVEFNLELRDYHPWQNGYLYTDTPSKPIAQNVVDQRFDSVLKSLTGPGGKCKSFQANFYVCRTGRAWIQETILFKSLAPLIDCETVIVALRGEPHDPHKRDDSFGLEEIFYPPLGPRQCCHLSQYEFETWELVREHMRELSEPHLSPSRRYTTKDHCLFMEFQPLKHREARASKSLTPIQGSGCLAQVLQDECIKHTGRGHNPYGKG